MRALRSDNRTVASSSNSSSEITGLSCVVVIANAILNRRLCFAKDAPLPCENDSDSAVFLDPNVKVSRCAACQLRTLLWKLQQNWELTTHVEETPTQLSKMFCTDAKSLERVLRSLSPRTLQSMPRWVFTTSCVSWLLEIGRLSSKLTHGQDLRISHLSCFYFRVVLPDIPLRDEIFMHVIAKSIPLVAFFSDARPRLESARGVSSAKTPDSSFGEGAVVICLGVVHMEEQVQDRVQVEVGREEQGVGETRGKEQGEEQRENRRSINRTTWMTMSMR